MNMENNDLIAKFMGYDRVTVGYLGCEDETQWQLDNQKWMEKVELESVGDYYVNIPNDEYYNIEYDELRYDEWNNLMKVIEKIESMGFLTSLMTINPKPLNEIGFNVGSHVFGIYKGNLQFDNENESSKMGAVYDTIIKFIEWYNQNNK